MAARLGWPSLGAGHLGSDTTEWGEHGTLGGLMFGFMSYGVPRTPWTGP